MAKRRWTKELVYCIRLEFYIQVSSSADYILRLHIFPIKECFSLKLELFLMIIFRWELVHLSLIILNPLKSLLGIELLCKTIFIIKCDCNCCIWSKFASLFPLDVNHLWFSLIVEEYKVWNSIVNEGTLPDIQLKQLWE